MPMSSDPRVSFSVSRFMCLASLCIARSGSLRYTDGVRHLESGAWRALRDSAIVVELAGSQMTYVPRTALA
jgi:hypothetical protein